jgi:ATP-dependent Clp protease protease subunit
MFHKAALLLMLLVSHVNHCSARIHTGYQRVFHAQAQVAAPPSAPPADGPLEAKIVGEVSSDSLGEVLAVIEKAEGKPVHLYIDSPGGDAIATLEFIQAVKRKHAVVVCDTGVMAASAASYIFEAVCTVRHAAPETLWLFHGAASMGAGKANEMEDKAKLMRVLNHTLAVLMAARIGMTVDQFIAWTDGHDRWLTTDELKAMGGAD